MGKYDILRSVKWLDDEDQARKVPLQVFSLLLPSMMATAVSVENAPDVRGPQVPFVAQWQLGGDGHRAQFLRRQ